MTDKITTVSVDPIGDYSLGDEAFGGIVYGSGIGPDGTYLLIASKYNEGDSDNVGSGRMVNYFHWCANAVGDGTLADSHTDGAYNTYRVFNHGGYSTSNSVFQWFTQHVQGLYGYNDWYIPARDELDVLYQNRGYLDRYALPSYWSSTEYSSAHAHFQLFTSGNQYTRGKASYTRLVRVVRREQISS